MVSSGLSAGAGLRRCLAVFAGVVLQRRGWVTTVVLLWIFNAQISNPMSSRRDLTKKDLGSCVFAFVLGFGDMVFHNKYPEMLMWHRDWELPVESAATPQKITYVMICTHIYVYMLWSYYLVQVWPFQGLLSGQSLFFLTLFVKNTINIGVSAHFLNKTSCAQKFQRLLSGPSLRLFKRTQLGPDSSPYLDQIITPENVICLQFFAFQNVLKYLSYSVFFEKQHKLAKNATKKR